LTTYLLCRPVSELDANRSFSALQAKKVGNFLVSQNLSVLGRNGIAAVGRLPGGSADAAVFGEEGIEESVERASAVMDVAAGFGEVAAEFVEFLFGAGEFVGDIKCGEHGDAERVDGLALRGDEAHLAVNDRGELMDVFGVLSTQTIALVEDINRNG